MKVQASWGRWVTCIDLLTLRKVATTTIYFFNKCWRYDNLMSITDLQLWSYTLDKEVSKICSKISWIESWLQHIVHYKQSEQTSWSQSLWHLTPPFLQDNNSKILKFSHLEGEIVYLYVIHYRCLVNAYID